MRLREVFRYELEHRLRSPSTWIYAVILFLVAIWMYLATADGSSSAALANAPERLAGAAVLPGMFGILVSAALFGDAAVRDVEVGMDPLLFTSTLGKAEYLGGRFLATLAVNAVVVVAIPLGALVATSLLGSWEPEAVGPFRASAYLQAYFLFLLPNLVVVGAILFTIGMLARQVVPVYLGAIGLFVGYIVALNYAGGVESPMLAALVDPLGLVSLQRVTRYWTEAERNTRLVGFSATLMWNRALWLAVAAGALALLFRTFRFEHADGGGRRRKRRETVPAPARPPERAGPVSVPRVAGSFGPRTTVRQTLAIARNALEELTATRSFAVVLLACVGLPMLWGWNVGDTVFDSSTWPITLLVAEEVLSGRFVPVIYVLIAVYAGELVWKAREVDVAEIADAAPVPEGALLLGRFLALVAMLATFQAAAMVGGMLIQALQGYYNFEIGLYLRIVFGLDLVHYVLLAALAMTIHVLVNHKYLGHIVVLMAIAAPMILPRLGLVRHHLLLYGTDPGWTYSDMNGFGPFVGPFVWFKLYWAAWALLLAVVAVLFWVRGREPGVRRRLLLARARFGGPVARAAGVAMVLIVAFGGFVFYNTNVLNEYRTNDETGAAQAGYEKRYGRFEDVPQPTITSARLRVEIYPDEPAVDLRGTYHLVNRTGAPIDSFHVSFYDRDLQVRSISLDRPAEPVLVDEDLGYRVYALERALQPGDSLRLAFDVAYRPRGFPNSGIQTDVVGNGAYFNRKWLPFIGYQPMFELSDGEARERFGLAPRPPMSAPHEAGERRHRQPWRDADLVHVEMIIGTAADQIAVTPGVLRRSWTENGRRYFHYVTQAPASFGATVFSAEYEVLEDRWNDVALRIFHHPAHRYNLDRMMAGMKASLEYLSAQFGPYPYSQLRIVENPRYGGFGHAHPETIGFTEDVFLARVREGEFDQTFFGTAHEVAHTWWGGQTRGADGVRGQAFLSESLANYSAMMVTEKTYGQEAARQVYDYQMNRYLTMRGRVSRDVPLLQVEDQAYIFYGKGAVVMYLLRDYLGEARVNAALRRYVEKFRDSGPPYPTSLDLYAELRAVTPDSLQYLLTDLFETVTLWDVRTERAVVEPTGTGEFRVTLDVVAKKMRADSVGNETEVPMNDLVEIGVFAPGDGPGEPLYLERHRIRSGAQTIRVTVPQRPARAGIDPRRKLIDRQREDNVADVETRATGARRVRLGVAL
ncbi:MAG TPA: M1 family aminopeptidase [Longimicrobiaceae bacterium]|nr:M1 family aminopeptidase [Longimicrobiaceae bacterium]